MIMRYGECTNNEYFRNIEAEDMSYGEELMTEMWINEQCWYQENVDRINKGIWIKKTGEKIHITTMDNSYINNCINMLKRKKTDSEISELWIARFEKELAFRQYIKNIINGTLD